VAVSDRDPSVVRLVWAPLPERALWPAIKRLGQLLEFYVTALATIRIVVDYR
jgi:hypothetical protein